MSEKRTERRAWVGFAVGYLSHLAADGASAAIAGDVGELGYLLWPITPLPPYQESTGILAHFATADLAPTMIGQVGLFALVVVIWVADGAPGLRAIGRWVRGRIDAITSRLSGR